MKLCGSCGIEILCMIAEQPHTRRFVLAYICPIGFVSVVRYIVALMMIHEGSVTRVISAPPARANPVFTANAEPEAILTVDGIESLNTYANGATMIGLRISGNLRGKLSAK